MTNAPQTLSTIDGQATSLLANGAHVIDVFNVLCDRFPTVDSSVISERIVAAQIAAR